MGYYELILNGEVTETHYGQGISKTEGGQAMLRVGSRIYPARSYHREVLDSTVLRVGRFIAIGASLAFESGARLSVIWGTATYCENKFSDWPVKDRAFNWTPATAEVYAFGADGEALWEEPKGWVTTDECLAIISEMNGGGSASQELRHQATTTTEVQERGPSQDQEEAG